MHRNQLFRRACGLDAIVLRTAAEDDAARKFLLALHKQAKGWNSLPKGWTQKSVQKFWSTLTGDVKHKVTKCIKQMDGKFDDPGAFCASLADMVTPGWRTKKKASALTPPRHIRQSPEEGHYQVWIAREGESHPYIMDYPSIQIAMREAKRATTLGGVVRVMIYDSMGNQFKMIKRASQVGKTILDQLGGVNRLRAMLGASQIILLPNGVRVKWPNRQRSKGNMFEVTYDKGQDLYDMTFYSATVRNFKKVKEYKGVQWNDLIRLFEHQTGWALRLAAARVAARYKGAAPRLSYPKDIVKKAGQFYFHLVAVQRIWKELSTAVGPAFDKVQDIFGAAEKAWVASGEHIEDFNDERVNPDGQIWWNYLATAEEFWRMFDKGQSGDAWWKIDGIKERAADLLYKTKKRRMASDMTITAFNKYNAPEVLAQLFKALSAAGLESTVDDLRRLKVPQVVDRAWRTREKMSSTRLGADIHKLTQILQPLQPYVKNSDAFLRRFKELLGPSGELSEALTTGYVGELVPIWNGFKALDRDVMGWSGSMVDHGRHGPPSDWGAPEYAEGETEVVTKFLAVFQCVVPLKKLALYLANEAQARNKAGFVQAFMGLFASRESGILVKAIGDAIGLGLKLHGREWRWDLEDLSKRAPFEISDGPLASYTIHDGVLGKPFVRGKLTGQNISYTVAVTLTADAKAVAPE